MYAVAIANSAQKEIRDLTPTVRERILAHLRQLTENARPPGCKKLVGSRDLWRIRAGDYRVIYRIDDAASKIEVVVVRHRSAAYE